jgi:hypothetical protein
MAKYFLGSVGSAEAFRMVNGQPKMAFVAKTLTDSSISVTITKDELRGGTGAPVVTNFFHDPAVAITLTDILFKEGYVEAQLGTNFTANASAYQSETIKAAKAGELTLSKEPVSLSMLNCSDGTGIIAWYSEEGQDNYTAVQMEAGKALKDSGIEMDKTYCVRYLANNDKALEAVVKSDMIPQELMLIITVPIFAGDACAASKGSKAGTLTFEVPRFQLDGGQEFTFNMSSNATMSLNGTAMVMNEGCDVNSGKLFRMIEVIDNREVQSVLIDEATAKVGASVSDVVVYALYSDKTIAIVSKPSLSGTAIEGANGKLQAGTLKASFGGKDSNEITLSAQ